MTILDALLMLGLVACGWLLFIWVVVHLPPGFWADYEKFRGRWKR